MKIRSRHLIGAVALLVLLVVASLGPLQGTEPGQIAQKDSSGVSVGQFLTPDGRFDLEAARRSGFQGPLNMKGFQPALDSVSGQPVFRAVAPAEHPDDIYWSPLDSGMGGYYPSVGALTVYDNKLIAGGQFTTAGGVEANSIAAWDGAGWSPLGSGMNPYVYELTVYDNKLIAGGWFTWPGGVEANSIAAWDGAGWSPLGSGVNGLVYALTVYDNKLIAGGHFTTAGDTAASYIAAWDGSSWSPLDSGVSSPLGGPSGNECVLALTVYGNRLIAGGNFAQAGGFAANKAANSIAAWNGSSWSPLGSGMNAYVWALTVYDNKLIAGGGFTTAGGVAAYYIAAWDGSSWSPLGSGMNSLYGGTIVYALTVYDNKLIAGGWFTTAGGVAANNIAAWDGSSWLPLGSGMNNAVSTLTVYGNKLIAGGVFTTAGGVAANSIAQWTKPEDDLGFRPNPDGWQFCNCYNNMWPYDWHAGDPIDERCSVCSHTRIFPTWALLREAFGPNRVEFPDGRRMPYAEWLWTAIDTCWGGSCFGFAISSFLFFDGYLNISVEFPGNSQPYHVPLSDASREMINKYWIYQFGRDQQRHINQNYNKTTPNQTAAACRSMFNSSENPRNDRILCFVNNHGNGAHAVNPYRCEIDAMHTNLTHVYVYDNNAPNDDTRRITFDAANNTWSYADMPAWGGSRNIFLMDPISNYTTNPVLPKSIPPRERWISAGSDTPSEYIECFLPSADSVRIESALGEIGEYGDSLFSNLADGMPIIPITGEETPPIGYFLPNAEWTIRATGHVDSSFCLTIFADSTVLKYQREAVEPGAADSVRYLGNDSSLVVYNKNTTHISCALGMISVSPDSQIVCGIRGFSLEPEDSARYSITEGSGMKLDNFGNATTCVVRVQFAGPLMDTVFYCDSMPVFANSTHVIVPDWRDHHDSLMILVDVDMTGHLDDTLLLPNRGEPRCDCTGWCDLNGGGINPVDMVIVVNYVYKGSDTRRSITGCPMPQTPNKNGDWDCNGAVTPVDVVRYVNFVYKGQTDRPPCNPCACTVYPPVNPGDCPPWP